MTASIVIVEDESVVALDLSSCLKELGYRVQGTASSAEEALALVEAHRPDLVLMDIRLEGEVDGIAAASEVHARFRTPVVYLTAYAEEGTVARAEATHPYGYLLKPIDARSLEVTVRMALARRQAELAVEQSEQRLKLAMDTAGLGVLEWEEGSEHLGLTHVAGHAEGILGSGSELVDQGWPGLLARMDADDRLLVQRDLAQGDGVSRTVHMRLDGERWGWADVQARRFPQAAPTQRLVGVIRDVSLREQQLDELCQASAVFNTAQEALVVVDTDLAILSVNPAFEALMGYTPGEVRGRNLEDFLHQHARSGAFYEGLARTPQGRWHGEVACRHHDGRALLTWLELSVVRSAQGRLSHFVMAYSDLSPMKAAQDQLDYLANHDELTGLGNQHLLHQELRKVVHRAGAQHPKGLVALLLVNIDRFQQVNEGVGEGAGDVLLKAVAHHLRKHLGQQDMAMRMGLDDFAVVLPNVLNREEAIRLGHRLITELQLPMTMPGHHRVSLHASVGLTIFPEHAERPERLIQLAHSALYDAKILGGGRCSVYSPELAHRERERHALAHQLRAELRSPRQLTLHFQPIVALDGSQVIAFEALLRWQHPEFGHTHPRHIVRMADDLGLLDVLDAWILRSACRLGRTLHDIGHTHLHINVNISGTQLQSDVFAELVNEVLDDTSFPARCLDLEFHESAMLIARDQREVLAALHRRGVNLVIDDLGTGLSSISMFKHLHFHTLKIDGSLVREAPGDAETGQIVRAMVTMAQGLNMAVTAEGIETPEQHRMMQNWGCVNGQGYLFGSALPAEKIPALMRHGVDYLQPRGSVH
jgi:diguanylate cyclase (GGDEF)-like protein/PAS domain S-box-containing protein